MREKYSGRKKEDSIFKNPFGSDDHKKMIYKIHILSPDIMVEDWKDYFATKSSVKILNPETKKRASKEDGCYSRIEIVYTCHKDNFPAFFEEIENIANKIDSYPLLKCFAPAICYPQKGIVDKNNVIRKLILNHPLDQNK